jgi:hypothetical protein
MREVALLYSAHFLPNYCMAHMEPNCLAVRLKIVIMKVDRDT